MKAKNEVISAKTSQRFGAVITVAAFVLIIIAFTAPELNVLTYLEVFAFILMIVGILAGPIMILHNRVPRKVYIPGTIITWLYIITFSLMISYTPFLESQIWMIEALLWVTMIIALAAYIFPCLWGLDKLNKKRVQAGVSQSVEQNV